MSPIWRAGAEVEDENLESLAALTANSLRHLSEEDASSCTWALITLPLGSTVIITVTIPDPMHLYAGMDRELAFRPVRE